MSFFIQTALFYATGILRGANTRIEAIFLGSVGNTGTLIPDATCCPVNIRYPQDFSLLNEAREKLDQIISRICKSTGQKKPRTYCRVARSRYLDIRHNSCKYTLIQQTLTFEILKSEYGIYAIRGLRGVPNSLSSALKG